MNTNSNKKILTFMILLIIMLIGPYYKIIQLGEMNPIYVFAIMWIPGIAGILTRLIYDKNLKNIGFKLGKFRYRIIAYSIPLSAAIIVYSISWFTGIGGINSELAIMQFTSVYKIISLLFLGVLSGCISAIGEEIGWRGFLVPELYRNFSYVKTSIIMSVVWNVYHYPLLLFSNYNNGVSKISSIICFTISVTAICFITTWLRIKSQSLWPAVILHATHNYFVQSVFDVVTIDKGYTKIFTTEFGIGLAVVYTFIAIYFFKRRLELSKIS